MSVNKEKRKPFKQGRKNLMVRWRASKKKEDKFGEKFGYEWKWSALPVRLCLS